MLTRKQAGEGITDAIPGDSFEHAVKRLCFRATSPRALKTCNSNNGPPCGSLNLDLDLNAAAPATEAPSPSEEASCPSAPSLEDLGPDLLLNILRRAHPTAWDLCRMACVNRTWKQLCYSKVFWTKLRVSSGSIRPGVEALAARCSEVTELHIDDPRCELFILHPIVTACAGTLERVVINCDKDSTSRNEAAICSILWIISLHCKKVETVELMSEGNTAGFDYIDTKALWYLTSGFRNMRSFACLCKDSMTKQSLYLMVIAWRELTCLRVHCGQLLKEDLLCLRKCHVLRVLELFGGDLGTLLEGSARVAAEEPRGTRALVQPDKPVEVIHAELEVLVLSNTATSPTHLATFVQGFPGLKRVLLNRQSWARGTPAELQKLRRQFGTLQRWLQSERGIELLMEE